MLDTIPNSPNFIGSARNMCLFVVPRIRNQQTMERSRIFYLHFEHISSSKQHHSSDFIPSRSRSHSLSNQPTQATPKEVLLVQAPPPPQQQSGEGVAFNNAMPVAAAPGYPYAMTHAAAAAGGQGMSFIMQVSQFHIPAVQIPFDDVDSRPVMLCQGR